MAKPPKVLFTDVTVCTHSSQSCGCYKKSALAYHIFNDHPPEVLSEDLNNFAFGVLKRTS